MRSIGATLRRLLTDERGVTSVEYAVLLCGLILGAAVIWTSLRVTMQTAVASAQADLDAAPGL